jgi:phage terminase large subunit-like protein
MKAQAQSLGILHRRDRPAAVIRFIEYMIVPSGEGQGRQFRLMPFQKRFTRAIYGPHRDGLRVVRRAILSMGRKGGKTTYTATLALTHLCGPEAIPNGEIYTAANERAQAALVFKIAAQIVRATPGLADDVRIVDSTHTMVHMKSGTTYRALSREAGSKYGLNPTLVIYDELAQAKDRALYDALDSSMGARSEPLFIVISTQSHDPEHLLSKLIDDGLGGNDPTIVCHLYETPMEDGDGKETDIWDERTWKASNPALGKFRLLEDMRAMAAKAKRMPGNEPAFRNLFLNQRVDSQSPLIPRAEWVTCRGERGLEPGEPMYLGLDLSSTTDLCALVAVSAIDGDRVACWFWKPGDLIPEHETRDRVPYAAWVAEGYLEAPPGRSIDYGFVAQRLAELASEYEIKGVAYDRWHIKFLLKELADIGVESWMDPKSDKEDEKAQPEPGLRLVSWGQGFHDMGPAVSALEQSVLSGRLAHGGHPILTWNISNAIAVSDPAGWRKLDKSKSRFRIDGAVALAMALGLKAWDSVEEQESAYEGLTVEQIRAQMTFSAKETR